MTGEVAEVGEEWKFFPAITRQNIFDRLIGRNLEF
jgi:hypothetical protein